VDKKIDSIQKTGALFNDVRGHFTDNGDLVVTYRPLGTKWGRYNINGVPRCCLGAMLIGRRVW